METPVYRIYTRIIDNLVKVLWLSLLIKWLFFDTPKL